MGRGAPQIILSRSTGSGTYNHAVADFNTKGKPHLLTEIDNSMGLKKTVRYASSSEYWLSSFRKDSPWISNLPFPVQVIASVTLEDQITGSEHTLSYEYHDGYYDHTAREFRGFGAVEIEERAPSAAQNSDAKHSAALVKRVWFLTGQEGSDQSSSLRKFDVKDIAPELHEGLPLKPDDPETAPNTGSLALKSLAGHRIREEVYPKLVGSKAAEPLLVNAFSYSVRHHQHRTAETAAVCSAVEQQSVDIHIDGKISEPRVRHYFVVEVDAYDHVVRDLEVFYRRPGLGSKPDRQQSVGKARACFHGFLPPITEDDRHQIGVKSEDRSFEIKIPLLAKDGRSLKFKDADQYTKSVAEAPENWPKYQRLLSWHRYFYWDPSFDHAANWLAEDYAIAPQICEHHSEAAEFSKATASKVYGQKVSDSQFEGLAKMTARDDHWWVASPIIYYATARDFFLPLRSVDAFGGENRVEYDKKWRLPVKALDPCQHDCVVVYDLFNLEPKHVTDVNGSISEFAFDPLGMVAASTFRGQLDDRDFGDDPLSEFKQPKSAPTSEVLNDPDKFLQRATRYFHHDLHAWSDRRQPPHCLTLSRNHYLYEAERPKGTRSDAEILAEVSFVDGFDRHLQKKTSRARWYGALDADKPWHASGTLDYTPSGLPEAQHSPYFSDSWKYDFVGSDDRSAPKYKTLYDALGRTIRIKTPDNFFARTEFGPWTKSDYDPCATADGLPPVRHDLDVIGHPYKSVQIDDDGQEVISNHELDVHGRSVIAYDPRGFKTMSCKYSLTGNRISQKAAGGPEETFLFDAMGRMIRKWDGSDGAEARSYDKLSRLADITFTDPELDREYVIERNEYAGIDAKWKRLNAAGMLIRTYDQAGRVDFEKFDPKGNCLEVARRHLRIADDVIDWNSADKDAVLQEEVFVSQQGHTPSGDLAYELSPNGCLHEYRYGHDGNLSSVALSAIDGRSETVVSDITYDCNGNRTGVTYGNGVQTTQTYDPVLARLIRTETTVPNTGRNQTTSKLDVSYSYDPMGRISEIRDLSDNNQVSIRYEYDRLNRLSSATARNLSRGSNSASKGQIFKDIYHYDQSGNLTAHSHSGTRSTWRREHVPYETSNRLQSTHLVAEGRKQTTRLRHDKNGNLTRLPGIGALTWGPQGHLRSCVFDNGHDKDPTTIRNYFDGVDQKRRQICSRTDVKNDDAGPSTDKFHFGTGIRRVDYDSSGQIERVINLEEINDGQAISAVYQTEGDPGGSDVNATIYYIISDHIGSPTLILDADGQEICREVFGPYGQNLSVNSNVPSALENIGFGGKPTDKTGLVDYGTRFYAPDLGRWISPDPIGFADGLNIFAFVGGDPVNHVERDGNYFDAQGNKVQFGRNADFKRMNFQDHVFEMALHYTEITTGYKFASGYRRSTSNGAVTHRVPYADMRNNLVRFLNAKFSTASAEHLTSWTNELIQGGKRIQTKLAGKYKDFEHSKAISEYISRSTKVLEQSRQQLLEALHMGREKSEVKTLGRAFLSNLNSFFPNVSSISPHRGCNISVRDRLHLNFDSDGELTDGSVAAARMPKGFYERGVAVAPNGKDAVSIRGNFHEFLPGQAWIAATHGLSKTRAKASKLNMGYIKGRKAARLRRRKKMAQIKKGKTH